MLPRDDPETEGDWPKPDAQPPGDMPKPDAQPGGDPGGGVDAPPE
jgi:hypothetical protein